MNIKLFKAKLNTGGKTSEQVRNEFDGSAPSEEEIQNWIKAYNLVDGIEVVVMESGIYEGYTLAGWGHDVDEKVREFVYLVEQDPVFGTYVDEREEFMNDWENEEYEPAGSLVFKNEDVEIIEELKQK
ncbi:hypothetical protein [Bacillus sp. FJAT-52991]|uniref:Phage protein n=1 Tax=Bacillus kandeliae TaxID=3129297 RepID=A0ABZ2NAF8_9BACI